MKKTISIPPKQYLTKASKILKDVLNKTPILYKDYYHINDIITDDTPKLQKTIIQNTGYSKFKISAGTSDALAFQPYIEQIISDVRNNKYYRSYNCPLGNIKARQALAIMENAKFEDENVYTYRDIALTEGSTGAISQIFEFMKLTYPSSEVIIAAPTYYLYKYLANYFNLRYQEAFNVVYTKNTTQFNVVPDIIKKISSKTKLVVVIQPSNPTSEIYPYEDIKQLLLVCKEKNILLLADELFSDLIFDSTAFQSTDFIAKKINALKNLIVVKGYSKSKNLAGLRIGYLFSKNKPLLKAIKQISEHRQCFASSSNYTGLIIKDTFIQTVRRCVQNGITLERAILKVKKEFISFTSEVLYVKNSYLRDLCIKYERYDRKIKETYQNNYKLAIETLGDDIIARSSNKTAFNTLVKIGGLENVNHFDFCMNFLLCSNIVTQIGPCFAFDQKEWQSNPKLGFWLRLSYSRSDIRRYISALKMFMDFKKVYLDNPDKFLKTNLVF